MNKLIVGAGCALLLAGCSSDGAPSSDQVESAMLALSTQAGGQPNARQLARFKSSFKTLGCKADQSRPSATNRYWLCDITVEGGAHTIQVARDSDGKWIVSNPGE